MSVQAIEETSKKKSLIQNMPKKGGTSRYRCLPVLGGFGDTRVRNTLRGRTLNACPSIAHHNLKKGPK